MPPAFVNQARGPGLRSPGRVELALQEKRELVGIGDGKDLNVAAFFARLQAVGAQPGSQRHVLRVALLRRGDFLAVKIRGLLNSRALAAPPAKRRRWRLRQSRAPLRPAIERSPSPSDSVRHR